MGEPLWICRHSLIFNQNDSQVEWKIENELYSVGFIYIYRQWIHNVSMDHRDLHERNNKNEEIEN